MCFSFCRCRLFLRATVDEWLHDCINIQETTWLRGKRDKLVIKKNSGNADKTNVSHLSVKVSIKRTETVILY